MDAALAGFLKKQIQKYEGGAEIESGKNVSFTANGTTVVQPSSGKDAMEQVTVTVNVPTPVLEANKTSTIDVSNYSEAVEITPSTNKDAMEKVTVSLSNIPDIETNKTATIDVSEYTEPVEVEPTSGKDGMAKATVTLSNIPVAGANLYAWKAGGSIVYTVTENPELTTDIYGCVSAEGISSFMNMTSDSFKIIQIVGNVLRIGSDSEHWAPYERNSDYDTDLDSIDLDSNKSVTIDVSTYTEPVEITPTAGKDGMKKTTVTLDNIPSGGGGTAYAWVNADDAEDVWYTNFDIAPETPASEKEIFLEGLIITVEDFNPSGYEKLSDTSFSIDGRPPQTYTRDSTKDFTIWNTTPSGDPDYTIETPSWYSGDSEVDVIPAGVSCPITLLDAWTHDPKRLGTLIGDGVSTVQVLARGAFSQAINDETIFGNTDVFVGDSVLYTVIEWVM